MNMRRLFRVLKSSGLSHLTCLEFMTGSAVALLVLKSVEADDELQVQIHWSSWGQVHESLPF